MPCPDADGGLAEYALVEERHLVAVPEGLDLRWAALAEPLSVCVHAVLERTSIRPGDTVVSRPGAIGLLSARLTVLAGAQVTVVGAPADASARLPAAQRRGARTVVAQGDERLDDVAGGRPDVWVECSGAVPALAAAVRAVRRGGTIPVVAMFTEACPLPVSDAVRAELTIRTSYASTGPAYRRALRLLASGALDGAEIATLFPLDEAPAAFEAAAAGAAVKPLIIPTGAGRPPATKKEDAMPTARELRFAFTFHDYDAALGLFRDVLGLEVEESFEDDGRRGAILRAPAATMEVFDRGYAALIDELEAGEPVSGRVRIAVKIGDLADASSAVETSGAAPMVDPVDTPWGDRNQRFRIDGGLQLTLFQAPDGP